MWKKTEVFGLAPLKHLSTNEAEGKEVETESVVFHLLSYFFLHDWPDEHMTFDICDVGLLTFGDLRHDDQRPSDNKGMSESLSLSLFNF